MTAVVAEGAGSTEEEALKDAFRAAVRQTLGSIVRTKTIVQDEVEVMNRIVTFSNGYVDDYKILATWNEAGFVHRRISAVVRTRELSMDLRVEQASVSSNGRGLWPEVVTKIERRKSAAAMYKSVMEDGFPWNCLDVALFGKPKVVQLLDDAAYVSPTTRLRLDPDKFRAAVSDLTAALEVLSQAKGVMDSTAGKPNEAQSAVIEADFRSRFFNDDTPSPLARRRVTFSSINTFTARRDTISNKINSLPNKGGILFLVGNGRKWNWYLVQESIELPCSRKAVAMKFVDQSGKTVAKRMVGLGPVAPGISINETSVDGKRFATVFVTPFFLDHAGSGMRVNFLAGCPSVTIDGEVGMAVDDFKRVVETASVLE